MNYRLDIGCSDKKLSGYIGMDCRDLPGVDIVHNIEVLPWPFASDSCDHIVASHVLEHIKPWKAIDVMDEAWRVLRIGKEMKITTPYDVGYLIDPTHTIQWLPSSFHYFDPKLDLYQTYKPNPWDILKSDVNKSALEITTTLQKRRKDELFTKNDI